MRTAPMTQETGGPRLSRRGGASIPRRASFLSALFLLLLGGAAADGQVGASSIDFGVVTDIEFPKDRILTLTNGGPATVTVSAATVPPGSPFRVQSGLPVTIAPGGSSPIVVRFSDPGIQQQFADTMRFTVAPAGTPVTAVLRGKKVFRTSIEGPALVEMSLGICDPGPKDTTVLLTNPGVNTLVVTDAVLSNDSNFTVTPPLSFPFSIPAGGAVAVGLRFNPKSAGRKYATLNVSSTAVNAPLLKVPLEGIKDAAVLVALSIYYGSLTPDVFPATRPLTIRNAGTVAITVDSLRFGAIPPFTVIGGLPLVLQPSQSADLTVRFDDPGSDGYYSDTLTVHHSPTCQILKILVAGTRISAPKIAGPSTLRFSDRLCTLAPKDSAVVISNTGAYTLSISAITLGGSPDFSVPTRLPRDIPTGMSDTISVRFTPSGWGFKSTAMTLWSNAVNEPQFVVQVFATADLPLLSAAPVAFGTVIPADFPAFRSVWLKNAGHAEIRLDAATFNVPLPYRIASALPLTVQPGDSVQVQLVFEDPGVDGVFDRRMALHTTPTCGPTEIPISGERFSQPVIAGPDSIRFATQRCPGAFRDSLIVVRNTGGGELLVSGVQVSGDASFSLATPVPLPVRIAPRGELAVLVRFFPLTAGEKSGVLLFVSNSSVTSALSIPLRGAKDSLGLTALPVDFGTLQPTQLPATIAVRISNTGSVDAVLLDARFDGPAPFSHAVGVPLLIPAGGSRLVDVTFGDPGADGTYRDTLRLTSLPQCAGLAVPVQGARNTRPGFSAPAAVDFAPLRCAGDFADTVVTLRNTGGLDLFISDASILGDADFALVPVFVPFTIARGDSAALRVRFQPLAPGDKAAVLRVVNTAGELLTLSISLRGRRELLALAADTVDFGTQLGAALPARRAVTLRNGGTVAFAVTGVTSGAGFVFSAVSGLPATLAPGDSASVLLQFLDPGTDTAFSTLLQWTTVPSCGPVSSPVRGERVTASATLVAGYASGAPGEIVELPLILRGARHLALSGSTTVTARLRFDRTLLRPLSGDAGSVEGRDRVISVTLPLASAADSVLGVLRFEAALGMDTATAISFDDPIGSDGIISIGSVPGRFTLTRVCREGGTRLVNPDGVVALHPNTPNPFNPMTEIRYEVIESAPTRLTVRNAIGAEVARLVDGVMAAGKYSVLFDATTLPSGVYIAVLETPTRALSRLMLLVK